jgi:hypothetical protein
VNLELDDQQVRLLRRALTDHIAEQRDLLVRTDAPDLQHEFARDVMALERLLRKLDGIGTVAEASP